MRKFEGKRLFLFFLLFRPFLLLAAEDKFILAGHSACPLFDEKGNLLIIHKNERGELSLAIKDLLAIKTGMRKLFSGPQASSPDISQSQDGQIGIVWERSHQEIYFGRIKGNEIILSQKAAHDRGDLFSPGLSFDGENHPWITWVEFSGGLYYVMVKNLSLGKTWVINRPFLTSAANPKIVIMGENSIWVFWTGRNMGRDEVMYSIFEGREWSFPLTLNKDYRVPHILQDVALDGSGFLWVVWSAYDGDDYEIYCSRWDGKNWSEEEKITDNHSADLYPSVAFVSESIPLLIWKKSDRDDRGIYARYRSGTVWSQEIEIVSELDLCHQSPRIAVHKDRIAVLWQSGENISGVVLSFNDLKNKKSSSRPLESSGPIVNNSLDEDKYIGFGDSITYGAMDFREAPDKGYIPRLETLLKKTFGKAQVINEGYGGETTIEGLVRIQGVIPSHLAKFLLLMEGTNDIIFLEITMDTAAFNLEEMALKCLDFGIFPLLATIIPRNDWRWYLDVYQSRIFELNGSIRSVAEKLKIPLVDQFQAFYYYPEDQGGWRELLSSDLVHPSEKGYEVMSNKWFQEIQALPFPPLTIKVQRVLNYILFYNQELNLISWENSPKIENLQNIVAYRVYRQKRGIQNAPFSYIGSASTLLNRVTCRYFDAQITQGDRYAYSISAVRNDGVEGPCSKVVND